MIKLNKLSIAVVLSLLLSMAVFATGAFAQSADQNIAHSKISVSARAAVISNVARGIVANVQHPYGWGNGWGEGWGGGWGGGCGWGGCHTGFGGFFHSVARCSSTRICSFIRECHLGPWGHFCRSIRICRFIRVCEHFRSGFGFGGFDNAWALKRTLRH